MNTTCFGAGSMRYVPARARMRWLATLPIGCAWPCASMRTNSGRPSFIARSAYQSHGRASQHERGARFGPSASVWAQGSSAQFRDRGPEHALEPAQKRVVWSDPSPFEIEHGLGALSE